MEMIIENSSSKQKTHSFEWVGFKNACGQPTRRDSGRKIPEPKSKRAGRITPHEDISLT
jgi:hypothetical protein